MKTEIGAGCGIVDRELDRQFGARGADLSPQARDHLLECERCQRLYRFLNSPIDNSSIRLPANIRGALPASFKPVSPLPSTWTLAAQFLILFLLLCWSAIGMMGTAGFHKMDGRQRIGIGFDLALGVALVSLSLAWQMRPGSLQRLSAGWALTAVAVAFFGGVALMFPWQACRPFFAQGWPCLTAGLLMAVPAALLFWLLARRGVPRATGTLGGVLGAIAGLVGVTALAFRCTHQETGHLLVFHGGVLVISAAIGVLIARVTSRWAHAK
jgi:hypothetical protein